MPFLIRADLCVRPMLGFDPLIVKLLKSHKGISNLGNIAKLHSGIVESLVFQR